MKRLKHKLKKYCLEKFGFEKYRIDGRKKHLSIDKYLHSGLYSHSVKSDLGYEKLESLINKFVDENRRDFVGLRTLGDLREECREGYCRFR